MAKAKKQETGGASKSGGKSAGKSAPKPAAKKAAGKSATPSSGGSLGVPLIDTSLVAEAAAKMVLNRAGGSTAAGASGCAAASTPQPQTDTAANPQDKRETSAFKQLKQGLNKTGSQNLGGILGGVQGGKKSNQPFGGGNQQVRNQTFGADVNRSGVPRRTGG